MPDAGDIRVLVTALGRSWDFSAAACDNIAYTDVTPGGCGQASWSAPFVVGEDVPPDYAAVLIEDDDGPLWKGRLAPWDVPDFTGCDGTLQYKAHGLSVSLRDQVFAETTIYGPRPGGLPIIALTPEDAIRHAVTHRCPDVGITDGVPATGALLQDQTSDYMDRTAADVVSDISGLYDYLSTPYEFHVRPVAGQPQGMFSWRPRNIAPRYEVRLSQGAKVSISHNPDEIFNRAIVGYGKDEAVTVPESISYARIPIIRDRPVNLTGQEMNKGNALQVGQAVIAKGAVLTSAWKYTITIPSGTPIEEIGVPHPPGTPSTISPRRALSGFVVRIPDLAPSTFGQFHILPGEHFITEMRYSANGEVVFQCGETRNAARVAAVRAVAATGSHLADARGSHRVPLMARDSSRIPLFGPRPIVEASTDPKAAAIRYGAVAYETAKQQVRPEAIPPLPPPLTYQINAETDDGIEVDAGEAKGMQLISPLKLIRWFIWANVAGTIQITVKLKSTGETLLVADLLGTTERENIAISPPKALASPLDALLYYVTAGGDGLKWAIIGLWTARYFPTFAGKPTVAAPTS